MPNDGTGALEEKVEDLEPTSTSDDTIDAGSDEGKHQETLTEREKALIQARDDNAEKLRQERAFNQQLQAQLQQRQQPEPEPEDDDDDYMPLTKADYKKMQAKEKEKEAKAAREKADRDFQLKVYNSANQARKKYEKSDFTYDEAFRYAQENFSENKLRAISMMDDPGQELYDSVVMATGQGREKVVKETLDTVNKNMNSASTLSGSGGSNRVIDEIKSLDKLSGQDFVSKMDEIIRTKQ